MILTSLYRIFKTLSALKIVLVESRKENGSMLKMTGAYPAADHSNWTVAGRLEIHDRGEDKLLSHMMVLADCSQSFIYLPVSGTSMSTIKLFRSEDIQTPEILLI